MKSFNILKGTLHISEIFERLDCSETEVKKQIEQLYDFHRKLHLVYCKINYNYSIGSLAASLNVNRNTLDIIVQKRYRVT